MKGILQNKRLLVTVLFSAFLFKEFVPLPEFVRCILFIIQLSLFSILIGLVSDRTDKQ
ncbi:unnamed protein product [Fructobacillus fructosus]|nr:unnamed protein product [Fructobacillus fructosus]